MSLTEYNVVAGDGKGGGGKRKERPEKDIIAQRQAQRSEAQGNAQRWLQKLTTWGVVQTTPRPPAHS